MTRRWAPQTRYTLRRNTASIMKGLVFKLILRYLKPNTFQEKYPIAFSASLYLVQYPSQKTERSCILSRII